MLEDILYLLAYNGFAKDIGPAVVSCKATFTDERIWFPFLIQQTYGKKQKTRLQILAEHTTLLPGGEKHHIVLKNDGLKLYRPEERWLARIDELEGMAKKAGHPELIKTMLSIPDTAGRGLISIACENNCPKMVRELLKRGIWYNNEDDSGATPCYYAYNSKFGRDAWRVLITENLTYSVKYEYPKPKPKPTERLWGDGYVINIINNPNYIDWYNSHHDLLINGQAIELIANTPIPPKPKKLKSKLYKQQFGPKR
uniref:Uncharacterized protein n=1 Tax=viral metagenome TaxID=1070528 RepID=A0A6C0AND0_9ZZZZ